MKKRRVWRYTCEHCKKSNCSASAMATHERSCTANPARVCRMCLNMHRGEDLNQQPMGVLRAAFAEDIAAFKPGDFEIVPVNLRAAAADCPCCMLAAIRQHRDQIPQFSVPTYTGFDQDEPTGPALIQRHGVKFDFKKEMASKFADLNDARADQGYGL